ncbi:MAG: hypothetical protein ACRDPC_11950 [Solirubrobacteraceae bacterium]
MAGNGIVGESWPSWAKALLIAQFALILAVLVPWILMWTAMAVGCTVGMGDMQQMMPMMPRR